MRYYLFFLFLTGTIFTSSFSFGQDFPSDLKKINLAYIQAKKYSLTLTYNLYLDNVLDSKTTAVYYKNGESWYYTIEETEVIKSGNYLITFDNSDKFATIRTNNTQQMDKNLLTKIDFESLSQKYSSIKRVVTGKSTVYQLEIKDGKYKTFIVEFDSKTYFLTHIKIFFREPYEVDQVTKKMPVLEINIAQNNNPLIPAEKCTASKYIYVTSKTITLKPPYNYYQLNVYDDKAKK